MTYFKDLTPRTYSKDVKTSLPVMFIGWLSKSESFIEGETSQEFRAKLHEFCLDENIVFLMRGFHSCEFCTLSWIEWGRQHPKYGKNAECMGIGNGEIRIMGENRLYAAPALIYHYVVEHNYKPPKEFIEAILTGPPPGSKEHMTLLGNYK